MTITILNLTPSRTLTGANISITEALAVLGTVIDDVNNNSYDGSAYTVTGIPFLLRDYNANDASLNELVRVLGTLIKDNPLTTFDAAGYSVVNLSLITQLDVLDASLFEYADALGALIDESDGYANRSFSMSDITTYQDAVDYLLDSYRQNRADTNYRNVRRAISEAYRDLPRHYEWSYYQRRGILQTVAPYSTGTIAYTESTRTLTLTGGTWPTWSEYGSILIDNVRYLIDTRVDNTSLTIVADQTPGADIAAGTTYTIWRSVYTLPVNFSKLESNPIDLSTSYELDHVNTDVLLSFLAGNYTPSRPSLYAIRSSGDVTGRMEIEVAPPPVDVRTYDYFYTIEPRQFGLRAEFDSAGTASVSSGSTAVTGVGTSFASKHVGCVMRFSSGATAPTGIDGNIDNDNPYSFQSIVASVTDTTHLTLKTAADATYSGVAYTLSDPVDMEPGAMLTYFYRLCDARMAKIMQLEDRVKVNAEALAAFKEATAADYRHERISPARAVRGNRLADLAIPEAYGGSVIT